MARFPLRPRALPYPLFLALRYTIETSSLTEDLL